MREFFVAFLWASQPTAWLPTNSVFSLTKKCAGKRFLAQASHQNSRAQKSFSCAHFSPKFFACAKKVFLAQILEKNIAFHQEKRPKYAISSREKADEIDFMTALQSRSLIFLFRVSFVRVWCSLSLKLAPALSMSFCRTLLACAVCTDQCKRDLH